VPTVQTRFLVLCAATACLARIFIRRLWRLDIVIVLFRASLIVQPASRNETS
jgi:hypothetical protein